MCEIHVITLPGGGSAPNVVQISTAPERRSRRRLIQASRGGPRRRDARGCWPSWSRFWRRSAILAGSTRLLRSAITRPFAPVTLADLLAPGHVESDQPDPLARQIERVAVNHAGGAP